MIELTSLGNLTCYAIIIAMACLIFKMFSYPLSELARRLNPFNLSRQVRNQSGRIEEIELREFELKSEMKDIKKYLEKLTKKPTKQK